MFEIESKTYFGKRKLIGHASIFMVKNYHASKFEVIFLQGINRKPVIMYEKNACLNEEELTAFENWFADQMGGKSNVYDR